MFGALSSVRHWSGSPSSQISVQMSVLAAKLLQRLACVAPHDPVVNASIQWLARHSHGRIEELSRWIGISSRHLQRRFSVSVGYGPKAFQSILRFQRLLHLAGRGRHRWRLAGLAADVGYADQAHMTREVHRLSGCPPIALFESAQCALQMSDLFKTIQDGTRYVA